MHFDDLPLSQPILQAISDIGHTSPTAIQEKVIPEVLRRNDIIACAQTGTGKTGAFAIPLLQLLNKKVGDGTEKSTLSVLIVSPTRELAVQIEENIKAYSHQHTIWSCFWWRFYAAPNKYAEKRITYFSGNSRKITGSSETRIHKS